LTARLKLRFVKIIKSNVVSINVNAWTRHYKIIIVYGEKTNFFILCESLSYYIVLPWIRDSRSDAIRPILYYHYHYNNTPANIFCALKRYCRVYYNYYCYYYRQRAFHADRRKENCNIRKTIIIGHTPRARQTRDTYLFIRNTSTHYNDNNNIVIPFNYDNDDDNINNIAL